METPIYQSWQFMVGILIGVLFCLVSITLNYRIIRSWKPGSNTFVWSTLLWGFLGYWFPVISTIVLHFLTKDSAATGE